MVVADQSLNGRPIENLKKYNYKVEEGKEGFDGKPSIGPVYRSIFARDVFPPPAPPGIDTCWDIFRCFFNHLLIIISIIISLSLLPFCFFCFFFFLLCVFCVSCLRSGILKSLSCMRFMESESKEHMQVCFLFFVLMEMMILYSPFTLLGFYTWLFWSSLPPCVDPCHLWPYIKNNSYSWLTVDDLVCKHSRHCHHEDYGSIDCPVYWTSLCALWYIS